MIQYCISRETVQLENNSHEMPKPPPLKKYYDTKNEEAVNGERMGPPAPGRGETPEYYSSSSAAVVQMGGGNLLPLSIDFTPQPYTVIVGRGKEPRENLGNKRLRVLASSYLSRYLGAMERRTKTQIISELVGSVKDAGGSFVKHDKKIGRWYEVDDAVARERVGYMFRDLSADQYLSSSKQKVERRKQRMRELGRTPTPLQQAPRPEQELVLSSAGWSPDTTMTTRATSTTAERPILDREGDGTVRRASPRRMDLVTVDPEVDMMFPGMAAVVGPPPTQPPPATSTTTFEEETKKNNKGGEEEEGSRLLIPPAVALARAAAMAASSSVVVGENTTNTAMMVLLQHHQQEHDPSSSASQEPARQQSTSYKQQRRYGA